MADARTMGAMSIRIPPATPGLLPQLKADWADRGWDPAILDLFRMEDPPAGNGEGGDGGQGGNPPASSPPAATTPPAAGQLPAEPDLSGLQAALDAAQGSARSEALQPLMAAIGVDSPEALQTWVTERQAEIDAGKDEATRLREAAERDAAEARAQAAQSAADALTARLDAALAIAGAPGDNVDDLRRLVDVEAGADREAITAAVEAVKAKYPALFTLPAQTPPAPHTVPARPGQQTPPASGVDAGKARAQAAKASRQTATRDDLIASFSPKPSPFAAN